MKANWDASLDLKNKKIEIRIVVRNEEGKVMTAICDQ